jgi:hypothetical protein
MHTALLSFLILKNKLPCICLSISLSSHFQCIPLVTIDTVLSLLSTMHLSGHHGHFSLSRSFPLPLTMHPTGHNKSLSLPISPPVYQYLSLSLSPKSSVTHYPVCPNFSLSFSHRFPCSPLAATDISLSLSVLLSTSSSLPLVVPFS